MGSMGHILGRIVFAVLVVLALASAQAADVGGVHMDDRAQVAGTDLVLNGAGIRKRFVVNVYAAGLYLPQRLKDANAVLALAGPKRVVMTMMRDVTSDQLVSSLADGMKANNPAAELEKVGPQIDRLSQTMRALNEAKKGDTIVLDFVPATGLTVIVNGKVQGAPIPGAEFQRALLRVWIGEDPADVPLKRAMLGQ